MKPTKEEVEKKITEEVARFWENVDPNVEPPGVTNVDLNRSNDIVVTLTDGSELTMLVMVGSHPTDVTKYGQIILRVLQFKPPYKEGPCRNQPE